MAQMNAVSIADTGKLEGLLGLVGESFFRQYVEGAMVKVGFVAFHERVL